MSFEQGTADADRLDNGLSADRFVALVDVEAAVAPPLLEALRRARIAAYAVTGADPGLRRVHVAADEIGDARPVARSALRGLSPDGGTPAWRDPLDDVETDLAFEAMVADWQVDTVAKVRAVERDLTREDADWRSRLELPPAQPAEDGTDVEEHYVPPPPPPLPRLAAMTVGALVVLVAAVLMFAFGGRLGLASDVTFLLGVAGILLGAGMLVMRLRDRPDDEDDDGAVV